VSGAPGARRPLVAGLLLVAAAASGSESAAPSMPARSVPACALSPLGDAPVPDLARLRGHVIYVDFWASWCAPCAKAFPFLNRLEREFRAQGLHVVGINVDENAADATAFLARHPALFELAADAGGQCPRAFDVRAMPSSYLVDRQGLIRHVHLGFSAQDAAQLRRRVQELLQE
jgi:thiol-disulfide isomerase/thioredoxin